MDRRQPDVLVYCSASNANISNGDDTVKEQIMDALSVRDQEESIIGISMNRHHPYRVLERMDSEDRMASEERMARRGWLERVAGSAGPNFSNVDDKVTKQIMDALRVRDQEESIIGICGPDKRVEASVKIVIRRVERDQLFEKIVTATVTKKPDITNIQMQVGDAIGLNFDDKTDLDESTCFTCLGNSKNTRIAERANLLCAKMKELQSVLVVMHDLHGRLDFGEIGIPFGEDHNSCKILLTSSNLKVLSEEMKVHKLIQSS